MNKNAEIFFRYLKESGLYQTDFAKLVKVDYSTLWRWLNGKTCGIPYRRAKLIERKTNGKIKAEELWLSDYGHPDRNTTRNQPPLTE